MTSLVGIARMNMYVRQPQNGTNATDSALVFLKSKFHGFSICHDFIISFPTFHKLSAYSAYKATIYIISIPSLAETCSAARKISRNWGFVPVWLPLKRSLAPISTLSSLTNTY